MYMYMHLRQPLSEAKYDQCSSVENQQEQVEPLAQKHPLRKKAPVHRPLEQEDTPHVKGPGQVGCRIGGEERQPQQGLHTNGS